MLQGRHLLCRGQRKARAVPFVSKDGSMNDDTVIVRCIQGHSKKVQAQMRNDQAHEVIESAVDIPIVVHATKTQLIEPS